MCACIDECTLYTYDVFDCFPPGNSHETLFHERR